jgi:hypothetical protein
MAGASASSACALSVPNSWSSVIFTWQLLRAVLRTRKMASSAALAASDSRPRSHAVTGAYGSWWSSDRLHAASSKRSTTLRARFKAAMSLELSSVLLLARISASAETAQHAWGAYRPGLQVPLEAVDCRDVDSIAVIIRLPRVAPGGTRCATRHTRSRPCKRPVAAEIPANRGKPRIYTGLAELPACAALCARKE